MPWTWHHLSRLDELSDDDVRAAVLERLAQILDTAGPNVGEGVPGRRSPLNRQSDVAGVRIYFFVSPEEERLDLIDIVPLVPPPMS